jgi:uncharacterized protein (DUF697 family)
MADEQPEERQENPHRAEAENVIHAAAAVAGAVGFFSPIPGADAVLISPIQAGLVLKLSSVYGQRPSAAVLRAASYAAIAQLMGKGSSRLVAALIPGVGSWVRSGVAVGLTEAVGWAAVENLEESGNL